MIDILYYFLLLLAILIFYLFIDELGFWEYLYESFYTHPFYDKFIYLTGDALYGLSISLAAAGIYNYLSTGVVLTSVLVYGIIGLVFGSYLRVIKT